MNAILARRRALALWLGIALLVVIVDQITKAWIVSFLAQNESWPVDAPFRLTFVVNTGGAFGLFPDQPLFFTTIAVVVIGAMVIGAWQLSPDALWMFAALGLQLGGAIGNLTDRIRLGYVVDFYDARFFPVFNVADSAICVGVFVLGYLYLFRPDRPRVEVEEAPVKH